MLRRPGRRVVPNFSSTSVPWAYPDFPCHTPRVGARRPPGVRPRFVCSGGLHRQREPDRCPANLHPCARSWCSPAAPTARSRRPSARRWASRCRTTDIRRFSNDCLYVQLQENCRQREVYVIQPLVPPTQEHLMELLLMLDAARGASAAQVTAVIPHYAYARSDKKDASRISIAGRLVADMLTTAGADRVLTMTLHAPQVHGFFSVPVDHLTAIGELADHFRDPGPHQHRRRLTGPRQRQDGDAVRPAARTAGRGRARSSGWPTTGSSSTRSSATCGASGRSSSTTRSRPAGRSSSCSTGSAEQDVHVEAAIACTHGLFAGKAVQRLRDHPMVTEVVTTDTVPPPPQDWPELTVRSVGPLFAEAIAAHPRRRVDQQPVRRGRPDARAAAAAAAVRHGRLSPRRRPRTASGRMGP